MKFPSRVRFSVLSLLLALGSLSQAEVPEMRLEPVPAGVPIPAADFFRKGFMYWPMLNASGSHLAALMNVGDDRWQLGIIELGTGKLSGFSGIEGGDIQEFRWLDDWRMLVSLSLRDGRFAGMFALDIRSVEKAHPVLQFTDRGILGVPLQDPLKPLVEVQGWGIDDEIGVVKVDAMSRAGRWIELGRNWWQVSPERLQAIEYLNRSHIIESFPAPGNGREVVRYYADGQGRLTFASVVDEGELRLLHWKDETWESANLDLSRYEILRVEDGPREVVARETGPREQPAALVVVDGLSGEEKKVLYRDDDYDVSLGAIIHEPNGKVIGLHGAREHTFFAWFSDEYQIVQRILNDGFKGKLVTILDRSHDGRVFLFSVRSDRDPETYYSFDAASKVVALIKSTKPWLSPDRMGRTHHFKYRGANGHKYDAYLTMPAGADPKQKLPMLVWAVADPKDRHTALFSNIAQFWASRGYAVLRANHRASEGRRWLSDDGVEWDFEGMAADLNAAVRASIKTGVIEEGRVGIYGIQDGAYLALLAAREPNSPYKAVVAYGASYDRHERARNEAKWAHSSATAIRFTRHFADQLNDTSFWNARSPISFASQLRAAVLVGNSELPVEGGLEAPELFLKALEEAGVPHESLLLEKGRSFGRDLSAQLEFIELQEAFLGKHL